jgi:hypothetical protein
MLDLRFDGFTWRRPASRHRGFAWQPTGGLARVTGSELVDYQPNPALYRDFAEVEPTVEEVLRFANKHGALRAQLHQCDIELWHNQIMLMRQAIELSKALDEADWSSIQKNIHPFHTFDVPAARSIRAKLDSGEDLSEKQELASAAALRLAFFAGHAISSLEPVPSWNARKRTVTLRMNPPDLLNALWLQFAHSLIGRHEYRQCNTCRRWFQVDRGRSDRQTCSDSCRVKAYQQRKRQALALHAEGQSVARIAKKVRSDQNQVQQWISSHQESTDE